MKLRYTKLRVWINVFSLLYEKTLRQSKVDEKIDEKEVQGIKKNFNPFFNKQTDIMKKTQFKVKGFLSDNQQKKFSQIEK